MSSGIIVYSRIGRGWRRKKRRSGNIFDLGGRNLARLDTSELYFSSTVTAGFESMELSLVSLFLCLH